MSYDSTDATNDFYDNASTYPLAHPEGMTIAWEIQEKTKQQLNNLSKSSVIIKSTRLKRKSDSLIGAYRYSGYSLYDILNSVAIDKANKRKMVYSQTIQTGIFAISEPYGYRASFHIQKL